MKDSTKLEQAKADLLIANAARNAAYWHFTRCTTGKPVNPALTRRVYELIELIELIGDR